MKAAERIHVVALKSADKVKSSLQELLPPVLYRFARRAVKRLLPRSREWEYIAEGWDYRHSHPEVRGWDIQDVATAELRKWEEFVRVAQSADILGSVYYTPQPKPNDVVSHNALLIFGYSFALASRKRASISMLDWGGGLGQYYVLARALVPDIEIEYHCREVAVLAKQGAALLPTQIFTYDDSCLEHEHDFVLVSGSLQFAEDWRGVLRRLASAATGYVLITQIPTVRRVSSFVMLQRAYRYEYNTEYLGWCFNRQELLDQATEAGLTLTREFLGDQPYEIFNGPEEVQYRGMLFSIQVNP